MENTLDESQWLVVHAILEAIQVSARAGSEEDCGRLALAAQNVMCGMSVEEPKKKGNSR